MLRYVLEPGSIQRPELPKDKDRDPEEILASLRGTTIGAEQGVQTPFGARRIVYTDYTASGRACTVVEDFVRDRVLPHYGNTHSLSSATARQTTYLRAEAREVVRHHLNASHEDAVIFAGNGSTGAAHLLCEVLRRAEFDVRGTGANNGAVKDMYYREDRWGGGECTLCGVRVKSSAIYQAHQHTEGHRCRLRQAEAAEMGGTGESAKARTVRRVVVISDPMAHHSTSLPFRELLPAHPLASDAALGEFSGSSSRKASLESDAGIVEVEISNLPVDAATGLLDQDELQRRLEALSRWRSERPIQQHELIVLCIFAAASNVSGLCTDVPKVTSVTKSLLPGAMVCWDYAAAIGHLRCDLNPPGGEAVAIDAAFCSPHKLWGGPGSVGVLAVKKKLLCNAVPAVPGGGVIFYVSEQGHTYIQNSEEREEAGTPNIVGSIRAGLVFHLHDQIPAGAAEASEQAMLRRVLSAWAPHPRIEILGPSSDAVGRTGVVSFMVRYGNASPGLYLHYNFVSALLNDVFGVQARGGCACAGPYAQWLLGISPELGDNFEKCLEQTAQEVLRPGFCRIGVHWAMSEEDLQVLIASVLWVAEHGWQLLAAYGFDRETGEWLHRLDSPNKRRIWLSNLRVDAGPIAQLESSLRIGPNAELNAPRGADSIKAAADMALREAYGSAQVALSQSKSPALDANFAHLLWFALPADVAFTLKSAEQAVPQLTPSKDVFRSADAARPEHAAFDAGVAARQGRGDDVSRSADEDQELPEPLLDLEDDEAADKETAPNFAKRALKPSVLKPIRGLVGKAIADFGMINDGDRVLVGVSGGKDSLCVLHVLLALQKSAPIKFKIAAATVDPQTPEYNPWPLVPYMEALGVEYHMLSKPIIEMAKTHIDPKRPSICAFCSRMKRGLLYTCMREKDFNVLVLGQHLDDFAESFLMSAIHNGLLRTMKANYWITQEDVRVCRPLIYVREAVMAEFAKENELPVISDNCPACFSAPQERYKMKTLLSSLEFDYPQLFSTLLRTMRPLFSVSTANKGDKATEGLAVLDEDDLPATRTKGWTTRQRRDDRLAKRETDAKAADEDHEAEMVLTSCGVGGCSPSSPAEGAPNSEAPAPDAAGPAREAEAETQVRQVSSDRGARSGASPDPVLLASAAFAAGIAVGCGLILAMRPRR